MGTLNAQLIFSEDFSTGVGQTPPAGWSSIDLAGNGGVWDFSNPGFQTLNAPITDPAAILDSDNNGNIGGEDATLESPSFDASVITGNVYLSFDHYFQGGFGGAYEVEVFDGTVWNSVLSGTTSTATNPFAENIDITAAAGGSAVAQVRFHWTGDWSWYWIVDNVKVFTLPVSPLLSQDPTAPTCPTGTNILAAGTPETGVEWYWQTAALGTSTATPYSGPYNVFQNGFYYIRAYVPAIDQWVAAEQIEITNIPEALAPAAPTADINPSCVTTGSELSTVLTGDANVSYYWQTVANGTSITDIAATDVALTPLTASATGTYYLAAFDASTSCWSPTSSLAVTVQTAIPAAPTAATAVYDICGGLSDFDITATVPGSSFTLTQNTSLGTNLISTGAGNTFPVVIPALPAGATVVSAQLVLTNVTATNGSWRSEIRVGLSGINTLAPTQISTATSGGLITPDPAPINLTGFPATGGTLNLLLTETFDDGGVDDALFGAVNLVITYAMPADLNWYDAATAGTILGSGTPFDCIGNTVLADPSSNGSYEFYASTMDGVCESATRTLVTVNVLDVNVSLTAIDETCTGYANGSFALGTVDCGTAPFLYSIDGGAFGPIPTDLAAGTYSVVVQDAATPTPFESNPITVVIGTTDTYIPTAPTATVDEYFVCSGATTQLIEATAAGSGTQTAMSGAVNLAIPDSNPTGLSSDLIISAVPAGATITDISVTLNVTHTWDSDVDVTLTGPNATTIELSTDNGGSADNYVNTVFSNNGVTAITAGAAPFTGTFLPEGDLTTLFSTPNGTWTLNVADDLGGDTGTLNDWSIAISYTLPVTTVEWYDMATNGNLEGTGSPFESVATTVLATPAAAGTYEFYAGALAGGCYSVDRTLVTVNVNDVNVELTAVDASCNNSATGSFVISNVICGTGPFTADLGSGFGPIPTDLMAGTYNVVIMDNLGGTSATYTLVVGEADAPTGSYMEDITDNGGQVSWTANGNETEWNVEWGLPGFTPGTGTEIGSTQAMDTFAIITGLDGNTNYDVYISANCGAGTTTGSWDMVNWTTDCGIYTLPFVETFEDNSPTRVCWYNINEVGTGDWTYETGDNYGITTAFEGTKNARFISDIGTADPITKLASPRFDFSGQDSVAVVFSYAQANAFGDQNQTKVYSIGSSSVWTEEAYYTNDVATWTTDTLYVADTTTQIAFEGINNWGAENLIDYVQFFPCTLNSGIDGSSDVCRLDGTFDLNTIITKGEDFGTWSFAQNPGVLNGSIVSVSALPAGTFDFHYIVKTPCATDTTFATLTIFPPSSAGVDGTITACRNEPIYLLSGLTGNVDLGGQWYNPSNNPTNVAVTTGNIPGSFNYDYIVSNGVCPNDTSNILVTVGTCDYLDVQELVFGDMNVYPNPTDGLVFISTGSSEVFSYELMDVKGQVLSAKIAAINGTTTTEISLEKLEPGIYMIRVYNSEAEKTYRIIKQ